MVLVLVLVVVVVLLVGVVVVVVVVLMFLSFVPFQMLKSTRQHSREIKFYFVRNLANGATNAPPRIFGTTAST